MWAFLFVLLAVPIAVSSAQMLGLFGNILKIT